jgi:hypothetical protein
MDTELVRARERGAPLEDLCAGLAYSVARNYLEKVVAGRPIGRSIMFQGGTASNQAVVAAFRQLLGRPVYVHPYNWIPGAIGAALLAARAMSHRSRFLGFESCAGSSLRSFECQRCENRCQVNRVQVAPRVVHFGDVCDRYSERDRDPKEICRPFPELFAEPDRLMESFLPAASAEITGSSRHDDGRVIHDSDTRERTASMQNGRRLFRHLQGPPFRIGARCGVDFSGERPSACQNCSCSRIDGSYDTSWRHRGWPGTIPSSQAKRPPSSASICVPRSTRRNWLAFKVATTLSGPPRGQGAKCPAGTQGIGGATISGTAPESEL